MNIDVIEQVDTRWFQDRLADKRLSQRQLAARMNLDPAAVSLMLRGRRRMSVTEAAEIARYLGVEVDDVLRHAGAGLGPHEDVGPHEYGHQAPPLAPRLTNGQGAGVDMLEMPFPMADGLIARLTLPQKLTKADAQRIAAFVMAFAAPE